MTPGAKGGKTPKMFGTVCVREMSMTNKNQAIKGVVWNHGPTTLLTTGETVYRYVVVGVLVTDSPIPELEPDPSRDIASETVLCGECPGLAEALGATGQGYTERRLGDAVDVLLGLDRLHPGEMPEDAWNYEGPCVTHHRHGVYD